MNSVTSRSRRTVWGGAKIAVGLLGAMIALFLPCLPLFSQTSQGAIQGAVFDQSGGAIAGATVSVIDVARGVTRALTTDSAGQYAASDLTPGTYTVRAEAKGFKIEEHTGVLVEVGQNIRVDLIVQAGEQTQTVTVTGEIPDVDTTDATLGGTVSNSSILSLPLNGRNFDRLLQLRPGIVSNVGAGTGGTVTNGMRLGTDLTLVEGIPEFPDAANNSSIMNALYRGGDSASLLSIDAIQEFSVQMNPKAEYGWKQGSIVNVGVKSGTNSVHGTAYAFGRDASATDATNPFSPGQGPTPATLEQFGGTAGGPILKDKLFWFASFEGLRDNLGDLSVEQIPSDVAGLGTSFSMVDACNDLNPTHAALGSAGNKINALSAQLSGLNTTTCVVTPASSTVENLWPTNSSATSVLFSPNLLSTTPLNGGLIKVDYALGSHNHISGMYYVSKSTQFENSSTSQLLPEWEVNVGNDVQQYSGAWTWTPNSSWVNEVRLGNMYLNDITTQGDLSHIVSNPWPSGYGFNTGVTNPVYGGLPAISISTFTGALGAGSGTPSARGPEGSAVFVDNVSYLHGSHAFKFGFSYVDFYQSANGDKGAGGSISFSTLESFLQGIPNKGSILVGNAIRNVQSNGYALFLQDDWRVATRVTVNMGLRWESHPPPTERNNYLGTFDPNVNSAATSALLQVGPGEPVPELYTGNKSLFAPRLGVAWDVRGNGRTVVRAAGGLFINTTTLGNLAPFVPDGANVPSIGVNTGATAPALNASTDEVLGVPVASLTAGWNTTGPVFPVGFSQVISNGAYPGTYTGISCNVTTANVNGVANSGVQCSTGGLDPNFHMAYTAQWNLDVQRAITSKLTLDVAYVGNHGFDQTSQVDLNEPPIGAGWAGTPITNCLSPASVAAGYNNCKVSGPQEVAAGKYTSIFPYLSSITELQNDGISNYNGLQLTVNERVTHGLSFLAGYTFSHSLDQFSQLAASTNMANPHQDYGNSDSDLRNHFTLAVTYLIPGKKLPGQMLEGWSVSPLVTLQGGTPWYPQDTTHDLEGTGEISNPTQGAAVASTWNYTGPVSAFTSGPHAIPCYDGASGLLVSGCTTYANTPANIETECVTDAQAPYAGSAQLQQLAVASLANYGCYVQGAGVLTPAAYGTIGNATRNTFRGPAYYNVDFSVAKLWKFKERYSAQFRTEFFNLFNRADFPTPGVVNPTSGAGGQFGCSCSTPDSNNPVLGSGGPRHIQFGLKLTF